MRLMKFIGLLSCVFMLSNALAQRGTRLNLFTTKKAQFSFVANPYQEGGFDACEHIEWANRYDSLFTKFGVYTPVPVKSVGYNVADLVDVVVRHHASFLVDSLVFRIPGRKDALRFKQRNDSTFTVFLPKMSANYKVNCIYRRLLEAKLNVRVYKGIVHKIVVVPTFSFAVEQDSLEARLNAVFKASNILFQVNAAPVFEATGSKVSSFFDNPSSENERYTQQMQVLRDAYFAAFPSAERDAYYVFIVPRFVDSTITAYMVKDKSVAFLAADESVERMGASLAKQLGFGLGGLTNSWEFSGPARGSTLNLMDDSLGAQTAFFQWEDLRKYVGFYSIYDNYESVKTNSGLIAYYFWEERSDGTIVMADGDLLGAIKRPFKRNTFSYHLDIDDALYAPLFFISNHLIAWWHIIAFLAVVLITFLLRRRVHRFIKKRFRRSWLFRFFSRILFFLVSCGAFAVLFLLIDRNYEQFVVKHGIIKELGDNSLEETVKVLARSSHPTKQAERHIGSEILVKRNGSWLLKHRKNVMYFNVHQDSSSAWSMCKFSHSSNHLKLPHLNFSRRAHSHYCVFNYVDAGGSTIQQRVFNHLGIELTNKLRLRDPVKRILLFVNGYRPTSTSNSFDESITEIQERGLEYPNSSNLIYPFDRYGYWHPWNLIDTYFQKRINPAETFYADGHFSVSTSNYENLIEFSHVSAIYPKRCSDAKHHTCFYTKNTTSRIFGGEQMTETLRLLPQRSNKTGFRYRVKNGYVAGRNVWQLLNELPNQSKNDTLYIVSHSMGYAYSLGIIRRMRGKINFGGCYIIAPENASAGAVDPKAWKEIWQYGSNLGEKNADQPCLQDGVAPQCAAGGIYPRNRVFIPRDYYTKKGFFNSHFIGYYDWIFTIPKGKKGAITQH